MLAEIIMRQRLARGGSVTVKFKKGQKVTIMPVRNQPISPRDSGIEPYAGQVGQVTDYYWIRPGTGTNFVYLYIVRIGNSKKEIVVHEDEIETCID
ncbi:unnamed protein product [marine sediment metagenome]|uniref:Nitrile hydratase beta subunit domain-containing protein n=1 Tax=marine sediment metagenome TaxID=412755 RepID=X1UIY6_9ZZZZ